MNTYHIYQGTIFCEKCKEWKPGVKKVNAIRIDVKKQELCYEHAKRNIQ